MGHYKFTFKANNLEILTGLLSAYPFVAFSEIDAQLEAWLEDTHDEQALLREIDEELSRFYQAVDMEYIPVQNWNAKWEAQFEPVEIGTFCRIRAPFHETRPGFDHEIIIEPRQAFGTGHHETTYMMIEMMQSIPFEGRSVLDLGSGTGVLSILAHKLGARQIVAIDIEQEAVDNTEENLEVNGAEAEVRLGSVEVVAGEQFDIVLANINRNAIMFLMNDIAGLIASRGRIVFSGFLQQDADDVTPIAKTNGLSVTEDKTSGDWQAIAMIKEQ